MRSVQSGLLGKRKLTSVGQNQRRRLVLLGENKERSLQPQIYIHRKTNALAGSNSTYAQVESARVLEIFRQIVEVSEVSLGVETDVAQALSTFIVQCSSIA